MDLLNSLALVMKPASAFILTIERFRHPEAMDEVTSVCRQVQLLCTTESLCAGRNDEMKSTFTAL